MGVYFWVDIPLITTPGIYHNSDLGLISLSSDGTTWLTIADKNLGATQAYNAGDTLSEANCGKFYQWGNNYGFPFAGNISTSSTRVNASVYGPNNYYSSQNFIILTSQQNWDTSNNTNLWGGDTGTNIARKGPCEEGYHVPSKADFNSIINILYGFGLLVNEGDYYSGDNTNSLLKIPLTGRRFYNDGAVYNTGVVTWITTSDSLNTNDRVAAMMRANQIYFSDTVVYSRLKADGYSIRPFKNDAVQPDTSRTVLYQPS